MELIRKEFEKIALAILLVGLVVLAIIIIRGRTSINPSGPIDWRALQTRARGIPPLDTGRLGALLEKAQHPPQMPRKSSDAGELDPAFCTWLKEHKLPCTSDAAEADPDGDHFSNREEFACHSDPTDANSYPVANQLFSLDRFVPKEFPLRFRGYIKSPDGRLTLKINYGSLDYTYFVVLGDVLQAGDESYHVLDFKPHTDEYYDSSLGGMRARDTSKLTLCRSSDDAEIILTYGEVAYQPQPGVVVFSKLENRALEVATGQELRVRGKAFKVIEVGKDGVVISDERGTRSILQSRD